jgi:death-on-curing protein
MDKSLFEMAAAYLFHISQNHPFLDGNKRTAMISALAFLRLNGVPIHGHADSLYELTLETSRGSLSKSDIASTLRSIASDSIA